MARKSKAMNYTDAEARERLEAALRGAQIVGHKPMSSMTPKRTNAQPKREAAGAPRQKGRKPRRG
jgi:hypothetical protein